MQNNGSDDLSVGAGSGLVMDFTLSTPVVGGTIYGVTVLTQPNHENCTVTNGLGRASANVTNVQVNCSPLTKPSAAPSSGPGTAPD